MSLGTIFEFFTRIVDLDIEQVIHTPWAHKLAIITKLIICEVSTALGLEVSILTKSQDMGLK